MLARANLSLPKPSTFGFRPDFIATSVQDIDFSILAGHGIKACFIDLDGTVVTRATYEVQPTIVKALEEAQLPIYIATNRPKSRELKNLKSDLSATAIIHPSGLHPKPTKAYYRKALAAYKLQPHEVVMIGDRYIQDIWGANRAGLFSLIVYKLGGTVGRFDKLLSKTEAVVTARFSREYLPR